MTKTIETTAIWTILCFYPFPLLKALMQLVWRLLQRWKILQTGGNVQFQCSLKFSAHINMFQRHYFGNKKQNFPACNTEQVPAAISESSKINDLFQNRQIYSCRIFETSRNFLDMVSVRAHLHETREVQWSASAEWRQRQRWKALASNLRKL